MLLESKGMKKTDLKEVISANTLAKLGKNETVSSLVIEKICAFLNCQPGDIMEYLSEEDMKAATEKLDMMNRAIMEQLKAKGVTQEQFASMMKEVMEKQISSFYSGENVLTDMFVQAEEERKAKADK